MVAESSECLIRALQTRQGGGRPLYSFFAPGRLITEIADISRIHRDDSDSLKGFQRKEIRDHVKGIADYLDQGDVLFPNSIILALSSEVTFRKARGKKPEGAIAAGEIGTLSIPIRKEGERVAWIVDGQQRSLALAQANNSDIPVPVVAFEAEDLEVQREQFILVNKVKPLPPRLINELLPEVDTHLPKDLSVRKVPSELTCLLNKDPDSPFYGLIKRVSEGKQANSEAVVTDTAIINMVKNSVQSPLGALSQFKSLGSEPSDVDGMYRTLVTYWGAVKEVFPEAWGLPPKESRLMHSAGIHGMGVLMDRIVPRALGKADPKAEILNSLEKIRPYCRWTEGVWEPLGLQWNEVQQVSKHVRALSDLLIRLDQEARIGAEE